jgi:hypothetical protein
VANPPKQKGTGGELEVVHSAQALGLAAERTSPGMNYDVRVHSARDTDVAFIDVLATRPDRGRWLATVNMDDLFALMALTRTGGHVEVKRYARFALHSLFEEKFPR